MPGQAGDSVTESEHAAYHTPAYVAAGAAMMRQVPPPQKPIVMPNQSLTIRSFQPINQIHQHLCAFHTYASDPTRPAIRSHHFCTHLRADLHQCVIYDSDQPGARLIGIEYVIPEDAFARLPVEEKKFWHSHKYEIQSGQLILGTKLLVPNLVSDLAERPAMLELHRSYGKTIHTWQPDIHPDMPLGEPQSMMAFTDDSQIDWAKVAARDRDLGVSTSAKKEARAGYLKAEDLQRSVAEGCDVYIGNKRGRWVWRED